MWAIQLIRHLQSSTNWSFLSVLTLLLPNWTHRTCQLMSSRCTTPWYICIKIYLESKPFDQLLSFWSLSHSKITPASGRIWASITKPGVQAVFVPAKFPSFAKFLHHWWNLVLKHSYLRTAEREVQPWVLNCKPKSFHRKVEVVLHLKWFGYCSKGYIVTWDQFECHG
jgi:hypothetical protein